MFILTAVVGSILHRLDTPASDLDLRGVYVQPTSGLLRIGPDPGWNGPGDMALPSSLPERYRGRGIDDDREVWEVGTFLTHALKSNPSILEVLRSDIFEATDEGAELRGLFDAVWSTDAARNAFLGYARSQRSRFDKSGELKPGFAVARLRVLYQGAHLLDDGDLPVRFDTTEIGPTLRRWKTGDFTRQEVDALCDAWAARLEEAYQRAPARTADVERANDLLLRVRRDHWA